MKKISVIRNCQYRNCEMPFNGRPNKKFCCIKCKRNELKYKQRDNKKYREEKDSIYKLLEQFKGSEIDPILISLYNKIYK